ncbi:MAG TPA: hypothetical protein V6D43_03845 [Candidatus Sericytochromatia bacterium]
MLALPCLLHPYTALQSLGIAFICSRSMSTVRGWFRRGGNYRRPRQTDMRHLALMDFLLEHYEDIPPELLNLLCACDYLRYRAKPDRNQ